VNRLRFNSKDNRLRFVVAAARRQVLDACLSGDQCTPYRGAIVVEMSTPVLDPNAIGVLLGQRGDLAGVWPLSGHTDPGKPSLLWEGGRFCRVPSLRLAREEADRMWVTPAWGPMVNSKSMEFSVMDAGRMLGFYGDYDYSLIKQISLGEIR
jgi:hypothetical protein